MKLIICRKNNESSQIPTEKTTLENDAIQGKSAVQTFILDVSCN